MIEIAAADYIIALFIFFIHVIKQLCQLLLLQISVCSVGRGMHIKYYKLPSVFSRQTVHRITAVKVYESGKGSGYRQAASYG